MAVSPALAENLSQLVVAQYTEAERVLLERMARNLAKGIDGPNWAKQKLAQLSAYRKQTRQLVKDLEAKARTGIETALTEAYERGSLAAVSELATLGQGALEPLGGVRALDALMAETFDAVSSTHPRILRMTDDAYKAAIAAGSKQAFTGELGREAGSAAARAVVAEKATQATLGAITTQQAVQDALDDFAKRGITGFVDKAGRNWSMETYTEMAVRNATGKAALAGHQDRLTENGFDLVIITDAPRECPLCFVPGTVVEGPAVEVRSRLEYSGDLISIRTASGKHLSGTPDHAILTPLGWRRLKDLHPGDEVVSDSGQHDVAGVMPDYEQVPTVIEEAGKLRAPLLLSGPARRDLDSDVTYREVHVVAPDGFLPDEVDAALTQPVSDLSLIRRISLSTQRLRGSDLAARLLRLPLSAPSVMRWRDHLSTLFRCGLGPTPLHACGSVGVGLRGIPLPAFNGQRQRLAQGAHGNAGTPNVIGYLTSADAEDGAELRRALAGHVAADKIVGLVVTQFAGHVWDLQTGPSWYIANGIIAHNCRPHEGKVYSISGTSDEYPSLDSAIAEGLYHVGCRHSQNAYQPGITPPMTNTADPEGYEATTKLRGLEREVRSSKRMQAAAMDPEARAKATKRLNDYRAKIREHVATTSAKRQPWRESFGVSKKALGKTPAKIVPKLPRVEKGALKAVPLDDTDLALQGVLRSAGKGASRADINDEVMMLVGDNRLSPGEAGEIMARWDALGGKIDVVPLTSDDAAKLLPYRAPEPSVKAAQAHLDDYFKAYPDEFSGVRTLEQMRNDVEANLAERFSEAPIAIRTPSAAVDDILSDGKFSTVFDTGYTYGGDFSPEYLSGRTALEKAAFGAKPKANPIYGYSKALEDHVSGYGDVEVVLKDSVRTRSTMTIGDSMNYNIGQGGVVGRPVVAPTYECVPDEFLGSVARGDWKSFLDEGPAIGAGDYAEVQIHGGVYLDDIASFVIHAPNGPNAQQKTLLARLKSAGIDATIEATP